MLYKSFTRTIRDNVFEKSQNLLTNKYDVALFNIFTTFTTGASLQLPIFSFNQITILLLLTYGYLIPIINTKLTHMFLLAHTHTCILYDSEHIQNTLTVYSCIKQSAAWHSWVLTKNDDFEYGSITICQNFMNQAAVKYVKISTAQEGKLTGSEKTITKDIVAIIADITHCQRTSSQSTRKPLNQSNR